MTKKIGLCFGIIAVFALVFSLTSYLSAQPMQPVLPFAPPVAGNQQMVVADLDNDQMKEIIVLDGNRIVVFDHKGKQKFEASLMKKL